jgi:hypothetical protein
MNLKWMAIILLIVFIGPGVILGIFVHPWFFLLIAGLVVIPFLFIIERPVREKRP